VFEADEEGEAAFSFWRFGEEFGLVGAGGDVEGGGEAEGLEVGKGWVGELFYDCLEEVMVLVEVLGMGRLLLAELGLLLLAPFRSLSWRGNLRALLGSFARVFRD